MTMRPGMNRDVQVKLFKRPGEQRRGGLDVGTNHKVGRAGLGLRQEII